MADLVLWDPAFFGIRPWAVIKSGAIVAAPLGDPNAAISNSQPILTRVTLPAQPASAAHLATSFVSPAALDDGLADRLGLSRRLAAVRPTRRIGKADMPNNTALPKLEVDPETFAITIDGELVRPEPVDVLPLAQRYTMF
jgi:urease subunit alpha